MAKTICITSTTQNSYTISGGSTSYFPVGGGGTHSQYNTEDLNNVIFRTAGTLSGLQTTINTNSLSGSSTLRTRKNTADGGQSLSIPAGETGFFEATSGTDTIAAGNLLCYQFTAGAGTSIIPVSITTLFAATTNTVSKLVVAYSSNAASRSANTTYYWPLVGSIGYLSTTEADFQMNMRKAGTFKNLAACVYIASTNNTTLKLRKNASDTGGISLSLPANTTGIIEDTSTTSTCAVDDDFNYAFVMGTQAVSPTITYIAVEFETTDGSGVVINGVAGLAADNYGVFLKNTTNYVCIGGCHRVGNTTESFVQTEAKDAFTFSDLQIYVSANGSDQGGSVTLMKGGVATALTVSTGNQLTGLLQDTTNTVTVAATDLLDLRVINLDTSGGAHSITFRWMALFYQTPVTIQRSISETPAITVSDSVIPFTTNGSNNKTQLIGYFIVADYASPAYHPISLGYNFGFYLNTTESVAQLAVRPYGGTFSHLWFGIQNSTTTVTVTIRLRKNGANGNQVLSIGAGQTGEFEDTSNTDTFANGDLVCLASTCTGGTAGIFDGNIGIDFRSTTINTVRMAGSTEGGATNFNAASTTRYVSLSSSLNTTNTVETSLQIPFKSLCRLSNLQTVIASNARTTATTIRVRKNETNGNQVISVGSGVTGRLEDTSNVDFVNVDDKANFSVTTGTGIENITVNIISVTLESDTGTSHAIIGKSTEGADLYNFNQTLYGHVQGDYYIINSSNLYTRSNISFNADWKNLVANISYNTINSGTSTVTGRLNGTTDTSLSASIGFGTTGLFEDTTHTATVNAGDLFEYKIVISGTSGVLGFVSFSSEFIESEVSGELKYGTITESPSITVSESLTRLQVIIKPISDTPTVSVSESLVRIQTLTRPISDTPTISISENLVRGLFYPRPITNEPEVSVSAGTLERIQYLIKLITNEPDVTIPAETIAKVAAYPRPISDTPSVTVSETLEKILTDIRSITNESSVSIPEESLSKYAIRPRPISDTPTVSVSESLARIQYIIKLITNEPEVSISALTTGNFLISKIINESPSVSVSETLERIQYIIKLISETPEVVISELLTGSVPVIQRPITEPSIGVTPTTIERIATFPRSISDTPTISISETLARVQILIKLITNEPEVTTSDVASTLASIVRTLTEPSTNISEEITRIQSLIKLISETPPITTSDSVTAGLLYVISLLDSRVKWYYSLLTRKIPEGET